MEQGTIKAEVVGNELILKIDLTKNLGRSKSGKNILVASTKGNIQIPQAGATLGLNLYK